MTKSRKKNKFRKTRRNKNKFRKTRRNKNKFRKTLKGGARIWSEGYNHLKNTMKLNDEINVTIIKNFNATKDAVTGWSSVSHSKRRNMSIIEIVSSNIKMYYLVTFEDVRIKKLKWILNDGFKIHSAYLLGGDDNEPLSQETLSKMYEDAILLDKKPTLKLTSSIPGAEIKIRNFNNFTISGNKKITDSEIKSGIKKSIQNLSVKRKEIYDENILKNPSWSENTTHPPAEEEVKSYHNNMMGKGIENRNIIKNTWSENGSWEPEAAKVVPEAAKAVPRRVTWDNKAITHHKRHSDDQVPNNATHPPAEAEEKAEKKAEEKAEAEEEAEEKAEEKAEAEAKERFKYTIYLALHSFSSILFRLNEQKLLEQFDTLINNIYEAGQGVTPDKRKAFKPAESHVNGIGNLLLNDKSVAVRNVFIHVLILFYSVVCLDQGTTAIRADSVFVRAMSLYSIYLTPEVSRKMPPMAWIGDGIVDAESFKKYKDEIKGNFKNVQSLNIPLFKKLTGGIGVELIDSKPLISEVATQKPLWSNETKFQTLLCIDVEYCKKNPKKGLLKQQTVDNMDVFFKTLMYTIFRMALDDPNTAYQSQTFFKLFHANKSTFKQNIYLYPNTAENERIKMNVYKTLIINKVQYLKEFGMSNVPQKGNEKTFALELFNKFTHHKLVDSPIVKPIR